MKTPLRLLACLFILASWSSHAAFAATTPDYKNVVYAYTQRSEPLWLDLYLPKGGIGRQAVIVFIHGGGWSGGSKLDVPGAMINKGFVIAAINYRLTKDNVTGNSTSAAGWPAQIQDVKAAVRYLRSMGLAGTKLGIGGAMTIDADRIGVYGYSAGGHLAALLGTTADTEWDDQVLQPPDGRTPQEFRQITTRVQAVCDVAGPADLTWGWTSGSQKATYYTDAKSGYALLLGGPVGQNLAKAAQASPVEYIDAEDSPFWIVHGTLDTTVDKNQSVELNDLLRAAGVPSTLKLPLATHTLSLSTTQGNEILQFFKTQLGVK